MNFLRQSFSSISDPPPHTSNAAPQQHHASSSFSEFERDGSSLRAAAFASSAASFHPSHRLSSSLDFDVEDARFLSMSQTDSIRMKNWISIEEHMDVPEDGGGILVPCGELPETWRAKGDVSLLMNMDRGFVFPGECMSIVVYVSLHDPSMPEIITPFRVAAMLEKINVNGKGNSKISSLSTSQDAMDTKLDEEKQHSTDKVDFPQNSLTAGRKVFTVEENKDRKAALLHAFQNSHFFAKISETDEQILKAEEIDDAALSTSSSEHKKSFESVEPVPVVMEGGDFDSRYAGGVARSATCYSLENGDIAVVLQVSVPTDLKGNVMLEVLQFEQPGKFGAVSHLEKDMQRTSDLQNCSKSSDQLLQWLLPLDNSPFSSVSGMGVTSASSISSASQRGTLSSSSGSTLFSFANLRTYSSGSSSQNAQSASITAASQLSSAYGSEWEHSTLQRSARGHSTEKEALLSFRGTQLEPQRFSVHCGLEGLYVPGWRWRRRLEIIEPVAIKSYVADCNTKELICVTVENVVPKHIAEVVIIIDSISIICQAPGSTSAASSVPIACIEVGENHKLPGLSLRPQEQHSFVLKPSPHASYSNKAGVASPGLLHNAHTAKPSAPSSWVSGKQRLKDHGSSYYEDTGSYAVLVSCRCNQSESSLHFKHKIKWKPRSPRDLLLSLSLESASKPELSTGSLPTFVPKVVTVQATNLTSDSLNLTLLAPSSKYSGSSLPAPAVSSSELPRISSFMSFHQRKEWPITKSKEDISEKDLKDAETTSGGRPISLQRSLSLPPAKPIESIMGITPRVVKERAISAVDIAAENNSGQTHLWLQSIIPLGCVPPLSTTAIRCELLPLTDGIITLDTLNISTEERDVYYPEKPLQIYATSSIGIGIP
ncbi:hypothetical protein KP509_39G030300 [Ceratopteris richardii]|uniref:Uncharacterized protein n=2 Tax=Ceratopteris richardii TaxID=49495 RepID=A0A8T2Q0K2_CERRI|nr:hypothetical protein KP509_39G030300 [Ceratopteris richardii]KAH7277012.1 hypothetical protein KP509_39G030300 [Ceratopteris richardii]